ncbi:polyprenyl synthetase family protein [Desulfoferrobacter suflitae]|uniref:polyprenyl synthetase family protein n=1 Tax=Desulfoferrobacter suflitae TaxID=2865782 RepID=UPI0021641143|nr:polyprenyl synthetase family protein [Desulfoferrobacter suflitae]MCK8602652.1 polyprenyl synthetase family protein [Desulfoferrobacter suflitae]
MNKLTTSVLEPLVSCSLCPPEAETIKERIYVQIKPDLDRIEAEIQRQLNSSVPLISKVGQYILGSGGKRLRPLLLILAARLCGYQGNADAPLAVVFEFVHAASLLHDDVVDHAEFRRNQPAAKTIWGNPAVVLVGDFLYSKSILMAVQYSSIRILEVLSDATTRMAEGEVLQLVHADNLEIDEAEYLQVVTRKTAVLISAACHIGAIFGQGDTAQQQALSTYGHSLGIAFQLIDDTLDYTGDVEELGKPVGNDIQEGKATLPLIYAFRHQGKNDKKRLRRIFAADEILPEDFHEVRDIVARSGGIEYTRRLATQYVRQAKEAIHIFPSHPTRRLLEDIADYVICRRV